MDWQEVHWLAYLTAPARLSNGPHGQWPVPYTQRTHSECNRTPTQQTHLQHARPQVWVVGVLQVEHERAEFGLVLLAQAACSVNRCPAHIKGVRPAQLSCFLRPCPHTARTRGQLQEQPWRGKERAAALLHPQAVAAVNAAQRTPLHARTFHTHRTHKRHLSPSMPTHRAPCTALSPPQGPRLQGRQWRLRQCPPSPAPLLQPGRKGAAGWLLCFNTSAGTLGTHHHPKALGAAHDSRMGGL